MEPGGLELAAAAELARAALALSRRFAQGGTLWCVAPDWPEHGRHVAVEFVHPVVMGKRALPAVHVAGADPLAELRTLTRPGDALVVVASSASRVAAEVTMRAAAWGVLSLWIGSGRRPSTAMTDHLLWVDGADQRAARHDGSLVLRYHVLWELTHVCLEHGELLQPGGDCDDAAGCITCSDEARPAEIVGILGHGLVSARSARGLETVDVTLVGDVAAGDLVLVHAGAAIERIRDQ